MTSLRESLIQERKDHKFISIGALKRLVTETSVQECLSSVENPLEADLVTHIVSHCPKIFAILALLGLVHHITKPIIQGLSDRIFPVALNDEPPIGNEKNRHDFYKTQWDIPPQLDVNRHLKLPHMTKLPFVTREAMDNGSWGLIDKVTISEDHLPEWPSVS